MMALGWPPTLIVTPRIPPVRRPIDEVDVEFDDMLRTRTRGGKQSQHVSRCLSGLHLNTVEQFSGGLGAELATNIERPRSGCDHALMKAGLLWSSSGSRCAVFAV